MEDNTTFSNRESLQEKIPTLSPTDTFSNKVSIQTALGIDDSSTFSNIEVVSKAVSSNKKIIVKDGGKDDGKGAFQS